jgi:glucose-1-phosphate thymidylyltransferase
MENDAPARHRPHVGRQARAVVLARGLGTRMRQADAGIDLTREQRQAADAGLKPLIPINGHPFLAFVLGAIADAGIREVALVVAPDHDLVRQYLAQSPPRRVDVSLIVQPEARGTADAVLAVRGWVADDPFLVMNADNIYPSAALRDLTALDEPGFPAFDAEDLVATSNIPPERVRAFALVEIDADGYMASIVEKPSDVPPEGANYPTDPPPVISMNLWRFDARMFDACRDVPRSSRGEFELPEAVGLAVARGMRIKAVPARGPVLDLSRRADAADVSRRLAGITPCP